MKADLSSSETGVSRKTIQRIIRVRLDIPSIVKPKVPSLTEMGREKRVRWARTNKRKTVSDWRGVLFADECPFQTRQSTGGRRVRKPRTAERFDLKFTTPSVKKLQMIIFWAGEEKLLLEEGCTDGSSQRRGDQL